MDRYRKKSKSTNSSPREEGEQKRDTSPRIRIVGTGSPEEVPKIVCPRCKMSKDTTRLGLWKEHDATVYFCGTTYGGEKACRNVWMPDFSYVSVNEVHMQYLPGPDGDYLVTFK